MRFVFKKSYEQDLRYYQHREDVVVWVALLAFMLIAPTFLTNFYINEIAYFFVLAIAALGLMVLTGYAGQVSLGHGVFLGVGAYGNAYMMSLGFPFALSACLSALGCAVIGAAMAYPVRKLAGLYLAMATYGVSVIALEVFSNWDAVTGGLNGIRVPMPTVLGFEFSRGPSFYYLALGFLLLALFLVVNLVNSRTGRALQAVRDSEIAASGIGINVSLIKSIAFATSAAITGLSGVLFGQMLGHVSPEAFDFRISIELLLMLVIGGLGTVRGALIGAGIVAYLPQAISTFRDYLPTVIAEAPALGSGLYGLILVLVILYEPLGLVGRWEKFKTYFSLMPMYKKEVVKRPRVFMKSEQMQ